MWRGEERLRSAVAGDLLAFGSERKGTVAVVFGLGAVVLVGLVGGGIDYSRLASRRNQLQRAVDAGALAGGNALKLAMPNTASIAGVTEQTIRAGAASPPDRPLTVQVTVAEDKTSVSAYAEESFRLAFGSLLGVGSAKISAKARASVVGKMRLCMLTLDAAAAGAFNLQKKAQVTANECSLYSNSANPIGMVGQANAIAQAQTICSAGGYLGVRANFAPTPQTGCPVIEDPLRDRPAPSLGDCVTLPPSAGGKGGAKGGENLVEVGMTLDPGTYCGGLHLTKGAAVTLRAGIYVMKDGPLIVEKKASLSGTDVGFYFTGDKGGLVFSKTSTVSLTAPTTGVMAGLLMAEERTVSAPVDPVVGLLGAVLGTVGGLLDTVADITPTPPPLSLTKPMRTYRIISDDARTMLGTIYLPSGRVVIDASKPVADQSAYTVVVAQQVNLYEGPNLYLNANYNGTSVPVPKGVGPVSGRLLLSQ